MRWLAALLLCSIALPVPASQDAGAIKTAVEDYLQRQTRGMSGQVDFTVGAIEAANNLVPCNALDVSLPRGARLWGHTSVEVHCRSDAGWRLYVPIDVSVVADYLVLTRSMAAGEVVAAGDLGKQSGDLTQLPDGILVNAEQAVGRTMALSLAAGKPLRAEALRLTYVVRQGQGVKVISVGSGFQVSSEGRALNNAASGEVAQVRLRNGKVVSGVARAEGTVEVSY